MPAIRALTVLLTAWALVLLAPPGPASAGGPTSALLSVPGEGRTASLYYTDAAYEELSELLGVTGVSGAGQDDLGQGHESGTGVTVTWLIHDVTPWRVDRIYLGGVGAPWVATQVMDSETGSIWDSPVIWHQPAAGKELTLLLDRLGVGQARGRAGGWTNRCPRSSPRPPSRPRTSPRRRHRPTTAPAPRLATGCGGGWAGWPPVSCSPWAGRAPARHGPGPVPTPGTGRRRSHAGPDHGVAQRGSMTARPSSASRVLVPTGSPYWS